MERKKVAIHLWIGMKQDVASFRRMQGNHKQVTNAEQLEGYNDSNITLHLCHTAINLTDWPSIRSKITTMKSICKNITILTHD